MTGPLRVWRASRREPPRGGTFQAIVVAGARIRDDGTPCPALRRRVERGVELWRAGVAPVLVMTGRGAGPLAEAPVMAELARDLGVPDEALALEAASMTTLENAAYCRRDFDFDAIVVVSCPAHVYRCEQLFGRHFARVYGVPSRRGPRRAHLRLFLRESALALWYG